MQYSATAGARQAGDRSYNRVYDYYDATGEQRFGSDERYGARRRTIGRAQRPDWTQCAQALVRSILGRRRILSRLAMNAGTPAMGA